MRRWTLYFFSVLAIALSNGLWGFIFAQSIEQWALTTACVAAFGGFVAWYMSIKISTWAMLVEPITQVPDLVDAPELEKTVAELSRQVGLRQPPQLGIYQSQEVNAFAVARTRNDALLAISSSLLQEFSPTEIRAVLAQRLAYIANGDAGTLALLYGQLFAFTLFPARMLALLLGTALRTAEEETPSDPVETLMIWLLTAFFTPFGAMVAWFFKSGAQKRADAIAVTLVGSEAVKNMLEHLAKTQNRNEFRDKFTVPMKVGSRDPRSRLAKL